MKITLMDIISILISHVDWPNEYLHLLGALVWSKAKMRSKLSVKMSMPTSADFAAFFSVRLFIFSQT